MKRKLWVVEMLNEFTEEYEPTVGVGYCREAGRLTKTAWERDNPSDTFRLVCYVPKEVKA